MYGAVAANEIYRTQGDENSQPNKKIRDWKRRFSKSIEASRRLFEWNHMVK